MKRKQIILNFALIAIIITVPASGLASAPASRCEDMDKICREFERLTEAEQPEKIIAQFDADRTAAYSDESRRLIGSAYLALASRDNVTPEQEEGYYWKALDLNHSIAYMGLYFFHVQKNEEKALGFLREYVRTKPADTVPYVILGESELMKKNYSLADAYLREAKKLAHAHSPRVDWLLFQASYLMENYQFAQEMFESAVTKGKFESEVKALGSDARFEGIEKRTEFRKHQDLFRAARTRS